MQFTVADLFTASMRYMTKLLGGMSKLIDIFQTPIEDVITLNISTVNPIGALALKVLKWFDSQDGYQVFNQLSLLDVMLEAGLGIFIAYTFIKWVVGIVTGS